MDKTKELIDLKKLYINNYEKFETRVFFTFLALSLSLILLSARKIIGCFGSVIGLFLLLFLLLVIDPFWEKTRKKRFNELINDIVEGKLWRNIT